MFIFVETPLSSLCKFMLKEKPFDCQLCLTYFIICYILCLTRAYVLLFCLSPVIKVQCQLLLSRSYLTSL